MATSPTAAFRLYGGPSAQGRGVAPLLKVGQFGASAEQKRLGALDKAVADFEARDAAVNQKILQQYSGYANSALDYIKQAGQQERAGIGQSLASRGLYNTSILNSLQQRSREGENRSRGQLAGQVAGVLQTMRPDPGFYGPLIQSIASQPKKTNPFASLLPVAGAAIGSIIEPGAGTAIGASIGGAAGSLINRGDAGYGAVSGLGYGDMFRRSGAAQGLYDWFRPTDLQPYTY